MNESVAYTLYVPMEDPALVAVVNSLEDLHEVVLDLRRREPDLRVLKQTRQVMVHEREHHEHC